MKLLLDTHILIWALADAPKLPQKARQLILDEGNELYASTVSLWEVVIKHALHPNEMPYSGKDFFAPCGRAGFEPLVVNAAHVLTVESLRRDENAPPHKDPLENAAEDVLFILMYTRRKVYICCLYIPKAYNLI